MKSLLAFAGLLALAPLISSADAPASPWNEPKPAKKEATEAKAAALALISVKGNHFVDPDGKTVLFRGVSIVDPDNLVERGRWNRQVFAAIKDLGANLVRIPVHPAGWRHQGPAAYTALLDQAVGWCTELGLYVIVDWHSIGNLTSGMFERPVYNTSIPETFDFWKQMAAHFKGNSTVAFFELYNEPTNANGELGPVSWTQWRELNEQMIGIVRYANRDVIPLVAGYDWAYDLDQVHYEPIRAERIGYVTHPYPFKRKQPWEPRWEENFGFVADRYPVIATEIGFEMKPGDVIDADHYGPRITKFLEERGISWVAWVFDDRWWPAMLKSMDTYALTGCGTYFAEAMKHPPAQPAAKASH
jgi:endoglucanase